MTRTRTSKSCDACKNRKTKCLQTGTGPCRYCASAGTTCSTSARLHRRPFYRVSEEEYQCCMRLLRHFLPDIDLDLKTMKAMITEIEQGAHVASASSTAGSWMPACAESTSAQQTEESEVLQEELGCIILDSRGSYRYVGADSYVRFANAVSQAAVRRAGRGQGTDDSTVMVPLVRSTLPPSTPESSVGTGFSPAWTDTYAGLVHDKESIYLPPRDICHGYLVRFFDEVQSLYWFYSPEQLYTLVDRTYADCESIGLESCSSSWLCSLYSIFAICSAGTRERLDYKDDAKTSADYLAMARSMGLRICDDRSDADTVRALSLLALALHSSCFTVTAYIVTGMAVRMAYSLGLHRNIALRNKDTVSRARIHRLWWTLYLLDHEVAIQLGYPCAVVDHMVGVETPPSCESVLDPGRQTPHGYQAACVALTKLRKNMSYMLYMAPALNPMQKRVIPFSAVTACLGDLQNWLANLPPHLQRWSSAAVAPPHRRAVSVLHLRYYMTLVYVQRPFLLQMTKAALLRGDPLAGNSKHRYQALSDACLEAAKRAVSILKHMRDSALLSSLVLFDTQCIQELVYVFLLAGRLYASRGDVDAAMTAADSLDTCMATLASMEPVGWCEKMLPELVAQVQANNAATDSRAMNSRECGDSSGGTVAASTLDEEGITSISLLDKNTNILMNDATFFAPIQDHIADLGIFDVLDLDMGAVPTFEGMYSF